MMSKPKVGIYGLTGCAGDQLVILNCEDELLDIVGALDIRSFSMATSESNDECSWDVVFVEGTVVQPRDEEILQNLRNRAKLLIAFGTCAVWGGVPAMKNKFSRAEAKEMVYGPSGDLFKTTVPQPLSNFVKVDFSISGCPIEKEQLLQAVASLLHGDLPRLPNYAVCTECKMAENPCLLLDKSQLCLGPITVAGCNARCPTHGQPCRGCRGPVEQANVSSEIEVLKEKGFTWIDIENRLRTFVASIDPLQIESPKEGMHA